MLQIVFLFEGLRIFHLAWEMTLELPACITHATDAKHLPLHWLTSIALNQLKSALNARYGSQCETLLWAYSCLWAERPLTKSRHSWYRTAAWKKHLLKTICNNFSQSTAIIFHTDQQMLVHRSEALFFIIFFSFFYRIPCAAFILTL